MSRMRICVRIFFVAGFLFLRESWAVVQIFRVPELDWNHVMEDEAVNWLQAVRYTDLCNSPWYRISAEVRSAAATNCGRASSLWSALPPSKRITCDVGGYRCVRRALICGMTTGHCAFRCTSGEKALRDLVDPVPDLVNKFRARRFAKRGKQQRIKVDESIYPSSP